MLALATTLGPIIADKLPKRIPIGTPVREGIEHTVTLRATGRFHSANTAVIAHAEGRQIVRDGNSRGNAEKRLTKVLEWPWAVANRVERHVGKDKWIGAGRLAVIYMASRWSADIDVVDGSASVWLNYFGREGEWVSIGYDAAGGLLLRLKLFDSVR